jgi:hypothetical protein
MICGRHQNWLLSSRTSCGAAPSGELRTSDQLKSTQRAPQLHFGPTEVATEVRANALTSVTAP